MQPERKFIEQAPAPRGAARHAGSDAAGAVGQVLREAGQPLDAGVRGEMESRFAHDFSGVRVHSDRRAAASAAALDARAYTVGSDVVFGANQYAGHTDAGRRLIAHELAHVVQQGGGRGAARMQEKLPVSRPRDTVERQADAAAQRVMTNQPVEALGRTGPALQRDTPAAAPAPAKETEPEEVVVEGVKKAAEEALDNEKVKSRLIKPAKLQLEAKWAKLGTGEKASAIGVGGGALALGGGALLSDPKGRKQLEGVNLALPFTLIPYMPLKSFKYTLPTGPGPAGRLDKIETNFDADDLINIRTSKRGLPKMALKVNLLWGYDPATRHLSVLGADATLGIVPGLSISGGLYKDIQRPPNLLPGADGGTVESKLSLPAGAGPTPIPDARIMINVDLLKFNPSDLKRQLKSWF
ncbi:MAG TPA: DUF4157 domain-containing protein [Telluria sp.]|nr:DUF4157 domain-containing protein [Telluria sp.]